MRLGAILVPIGLAACAAGNEQLERDVKTLQAELDVARAEQREMARRIAVLEKQIEEADAEEKVPPHRRLPVVKLVPPAAATPPPLATDIPFTEPSADELERIFASAGGPQDGDRDFREALGHWRNGDRPRAAAAFEAFARKFPRHSEADNALLVSGSLYFQMELPSRAQGPLDTLSREYLASDVLADGLLLSARCRNMMDKKDEARALLARVVDDFPNTDAARQAKAELDRLPK